MLDPRATLNFNHCYARADTSKRNPGTRGGDAVPCMVRLRREQAERIDDWREKRAPECSRPEAIRRLIDIGTHCEPYVAELLKHLEHAAEIEYHEVQDTVAALRRALGEADKVVEP